MFIMCSNWSRNSSFKNRSFSWCRLKIEIFKKYLKSTGKNILTATDLFSVVVLIVAMLVEEVFFIVSSTRSTRRRCLTGVTVLDDDTSILRLPVGSCF